MVAINSSQKFKTHLAEKNFTAQIQVKDKSVGRWITFNNGNIISSSGFHKKPEVVLSFKNSDVAVTLMMPLVWLFYLKNLLINWIKLMLLKTLTLPSMVQMNLHFGLHKH